MGIARCVLALSLAGCFGPDASSLADLRGAPNVSMYVYTSESCHKPDGAWCWPIVDDKYIVRYLELTVSFADAGDVKLTHLPAATLDGTVAKVDDFSTAGWLDYEWNLEDTSRAISVELADGSDHWTLAIAAPVARDVELALPPPPPSAPPILHAGDPLRATIAPAPSEMTATAQFSDPPNNFDLSTGAGTLVYDSATGVLAGTVPAVGTAWGQLDIAGTIPRAVTCDGPASCTTELTDGFTIHQLIQIQ